MGILQFQSLWSPKVHGYVIDLLVLQPTSPADSEGDAETEAYIDAEETKISAFAGPADQQ